jgi:hypothetical protein
MAGRPGEVAAANLRPVPQVATTVAMERIVLPRLRGPVTLWVDAIGATVEVHAPKDPRRLGGALAAAVNAGALCPKVEVHGRAAVMRCRTRHLQATLVTVRGRLQLDLREVRGLPWSNGPDAAPLVGYDPEKLGLGGPCPGTTPAGRGECAYAAGQLAVAISLFEEALESPHREMATVRLGDLALRRGDPAAAAERYRSVKPKGFFGRVAAARLCELLGACLREKDFGGVFEPTDLPEPWRTEMELHRARAQAFMGKAGAAGHALAERIVASDRPPACASAESLCRQLALAALREPGADGAVDALTLYFAVPVDLREPTAAPLAEAAAAKAAAIGAPVFAANLLATTVAHTPPEDLNERLLRTAELYLAGDDSARARAIVDFARTRLRRAALAESRWAGVIRSTSAAPENAAKTTDAGAAKELARALAAAAQARGAKPTDQAGKAP